MNAARLPALTDAPAIRPERPFLAHPTGTDWPGLHGQNPR